MLHTMILTRLRNRIMDRYGLARLDIGCAEDHFVAWAGPERNTVTLVFVNGLGAGKEQWGEPIFALANRYTCIFLELPGTGEADDLEKSERSVHEMAASLKSYLSSRYFDHKRVVLVGSSIGGAICLLCATSQKSRVDALILLSPAGVESPSVTPLLEQCLQSKSHPFAYRSLGEMEALWKIIFFKPVDVPLIVRYALAKRGASVVS